MILDRASMAEWLEAIKADGQIGHEAIAHCERLCRLIDPSRENRIPLRHAAPASYPDDSSSTAVEAFETWRDRLNEQITDAGGSFSLEVTPHEGVPFNQVLCWFEGERNSAPAAEASTGDGRPQSGVPSPAPAKKTVPSSASSAGVQKQLSDWATGEDRSPVLLLLGEYGSGKSTQCRRFAELLDRNKHEVDPVYLDLKQARQLFFSETPNLRSRRFRTEDIRLLIDAAVNSEEQSVDDCIGLMAAGNCLVICDGLDEVGSSLHPDETQSLVQALLTFLGIAGKSRKSSNRLLISCRNHFFRNVRQQAALIGSGSGIRTPEIVTLEPLDPEAIKAALIGVTADAEKAHELMQGLNGLAVMAKRPLWLDAIGQRIEAIRMERETRGSINLANLFDDLIDETLALEENRQIFDADIKKQLMVSLAGDMWSSGHDAWSVSELNAWLDTQLRTDERLKDIYASSYKGKARELLYEDIRTTTFLVRGDDDLFRFSDSPIKAFFLAGYLFTATKDGKFDAWEINETDHDVQIFLTDLLFDNATKKERKAFLESIGTMLSEPYRPMSSDLAFGIALQAQERGDPDAPRGGFQIPGMNLSGLGQHFPQVGYEFTGSNLAGANLADARIIGASFKECDLSGARIENAYFEDVDFSSCKFEDAQISGTIFRQCNLKDARLEMAECEDNLLSFNDDIEKETRDVLIESDNSIAPSTAVEWRRIAIRREHLERKPDAGRNILRCVYSPDGKLVLSSCDDGTLHIWNSDSGVGHTVLAGHAGAVRSCAFSPDGRLIVSGSDDTTVRLWDAGTGEEKAVFRGHTLAVTCCMFNADGSRVISGSEDAVLKVWNCKSRDLVHTLVGHEGPVAACDTNSAGTLIVSASTDKTLRFWNLATGSEAFPAADHEAALTACAFSPAGDRVVSSSRDDLLHVWDATTGKAIAVMPGHEDSIRTVAFAPDGKTVVSASKDKTVRVWNSETGDIIKVVTDHSSPLTSVSYSKDGKSAITSSEDGMMRLWDTQIWQAAAAFPQQESTVLGCSFSSDGHHIVSWSDDGTLCVWDAARNPELACLEGHVDWIHECRFSPDGTRIASAARDNTLRLWDAEDGSMIAVLGGHDNWVQCLAFSPDGTRVISGSDDNSLRLWDGATGDPIARLDGHGGSVNICAYSADGSRILSGSDDGTLRLWHGTTGHQIAVLQGHTNWVRAGTFSDDGKYIVSGSYNSGLRVWNGETGKPIAALKGHSDSITCCRFNHDGSRIVSGSNDRTVRLWDTKNATEVFVLKGHEAPITACCFSPDGHLVLSASEDATLRIWNAETGELISLLKGHDGIVNDCAFSPDGDRIISCCDDRSLKIWDSRSGTPISTLKGHTAFVKICSFSPDGSRIVSGAYDNTLRVWDGNTGCEIANCHHIPDGGHLTFSRSEDLVVSASSNAWQYFRWNARDSGSRPLTMPLEADPEVGFLTDDGFRRA